MTTLSNRKTRLVFETADTVRENSKLRAVIIEAQPMIAYVRLKGTRRAFPISYAAIYHAAEDESRQSVSELKRKHNDSDEQLRSCSIPTPHCS